MTAACFPSPPACIFQTLNEAEEAPAREPERGEKKEPLRTFGSSGFGIEDCSSSSSSSAWPSRRRLASCIQAEAAAAGREREAGLLPPWDEGWLSLASIDACAGLGDPHSHPSSLPAELAIDEFFSLSRGRPHSRGWRVGAGGRRRGGKGGRKQSESCHQGSNCILFSDPFSSAPKGLRAKVAFQKGSKRGVQTVVNDGGYLPWQLWRRKWSDWKAPAAAAALRRRR